MKLSRPSIILIKDISHIEPIFILISINLDLNAGKKSRYRFSIIEWRDFNLRLVVLSITLIGLILCFYQFLFKVFGLSRLY
jgi:hypothetical protein